MSTPSQPRLDVALATFNGERWLGEFLLSLARQSRRPDRLVVLDDGSSDDSVGKVTDFCGRNGLECVCRVSPRRLGPAGAYSEVLGDCDGDYVALADQDDVWREDKLQILLRKIREAEDHVGAARPVLVFSDYSLMDEKGRTAGGSGLREQGFDPTKGGRFARLLVQNIAAGCTVMANAALMRTALPVPENAIMHDWWLALVASALGRTAYVDQALVRYRQHGGNVVGASPAGWGRALRKLRTSGLADVREGYRRALRQASALSARYPGRLPAEEAESLAAFLALPRLGPWSRRMRALRAGLGKDGLLRTLALYWVM